MGPLPPAGQFLTRSTFFPPWPNPAHMESWGCGSMQVSSIRMSSEGLGHGCWRRGGVYRKGVGPLVDCDWTWKRNWQTPQLLVGMAEGLVTRGCGML